MTLPDEAWSRAAIARAAQIEAEYATTNAEDAVRQLALRCARWERECAVMEMRLAAKGGASLTDGDEDTAT